MSPITITKTPRRNHALPSKAHFALLALIILSVILWIIVTQLRFQFPTRKNTNKCLVSHGRYAGSIYAKPGETLNNACLVESPWMRLAQHSVRLLPDDNDNGSDGDGKAGKGVVVDDWLWIDYHDRINVLVEAPRSTSDSTANDAADADADADVDVDGPHTTSSASAQETSFMVLSQTKYALNQMSLAVVGGIIEPNEEAMDAAQREVEEELSVSCADWKALGKFRTDVNRGMGWVHPYLARDCLYSSNANISNENNANNADTNPNEEVGGHDTEKQHVQIMKLSDVKEAVMDGKFVEVQWSNTVALAMLHYLSLKD